MQVPEHLLDLIRVVRPKAALFTSFTFSVSYFDAVFVPVLRSVGCEDIAVLVDADQAALSAEESVSRAAGRIYRIAPVIAPGGGVFHPKLAYLAAEADDVLSISSGNLTASGQSLQLESFDAVSASSTPTVFQEFSEWSKALADLIKDSSPQAAKLLAHTAPRARQAYQRNAPLTPGPLPAPTLVHTLEGTARAALEAVFIAEADYAESVVVLSPFHSPDGGPLLRLAASVDAKALSVGLDASRPKLVAPFERGRFKPELPGSFVRADAHRGHRPLHAKVFELLAKDKVLVMTGSVNATAQSFESTKNVEMSLARWLPESPFTWAEAEPQDYAETQKASDFQPRQSLYVDAWLGDDRTLQGRVTSRGATPNSLELTLHRGDLQIFSQEISLSDKGEFGGVQVPVFDSSQGTLLTVANEDTSASCWLNVYEELDLAAEERERRAAVARVLRGEYAAEDIAEVVRLLTTGAQAVASGATSSLRRTSSEAQAEAEVPFSFLRWERSGQQRGGSTMLGGNPSELLKAITKWLNRDLDPAAAPEMQIPASGGPNTNVQLLGPDGTPPASTGVSTYQLLDHLCQVIPAALERQPGFEYAGLLAEVVASRAIERALTQDLKMAPTLSWLDRFSRFTYPETAQAGICAVAVATACVTACQLEALGADPQLAVMREAVERFSGSQLSADQLRKSVEAGLERELFRRVPVVQREAVVSMSKRLAEVQTLDESLLALLRKALTGPRHTLTAEPEAAAFPEVTAALRERKPRKADLIRGLVDEASLVRKGAGCPFCYYAFSEQHLATLRQKHVLVHKGLTCNRILMLAGPAGRLQQGIEELPDA